jgi:UMF1 family MFS transporter
VAGDDFVLPRVAGEIAIGTSTTSRKTIWGWALYDFGNSAFTTLIVTFIYSVFFAQEIAPDGDTGTIMWAYAVSFTAIVVAVTSPFLGAMADRGGHRRRYLFITTAVAIVGSALLYVPTPGEVRLALVIFVIGNIAFELSGVFYNSYLPDISTPDNIGKISGYGWSLGYVGGLLAMGIALVGFVLPESPWFGISAGEEGLFQNVRAIALLVALWFAVFAIPMFRWVPEPEHPTAPPLGQLLRGTVNQLANTFRHIRSYGQIVRLLIARMFYNDGLVTIFALGPLYAAEVFEFTLIEVMYWGLALNATAGLGAFVMGFLDDRIGGRKTILISLVGLTLATAWATLAPGDSKTSMFLAGLVVGIFVGPNQAASRSLLGRFVPPEKETEFYGFFAFSGKAIAFLGTAVYAGMTTAFGSQRYGVGAIIVFFLIGGLILATVDERAGVAASGRAIAP